MWLCLENRFNAKPNRPTALLNCLDELATWPCSTVWVELWSTLATSQVWSSARTAWLWATKAFAGASLARGMDCGPIAISMLNSFTTTDSDVTCFHQIFFGFQNPFRQYLMLPCILPSNTKAEGRPQQWYQPHGWARGLVPHALHLALSGYRYIARFILTCYMLSFTSNLKVSDEIDPWWLLQEIQAECEGGKSPPTRGPNWSNHEHWQQT